MKTGFVMESINLIPFQSNLRLLRYSTGKMNSDEEDGSGFRETGVFSGVERTTWGKIVLKSVNSSGWWLRIAFGLLILLGHNVQQNGALDLGKLLLFIFLFFL